MVVINLWGAPGSGKSTTAAGLFFLMKINKFKVELVTEYAKDLVWNGHEAMFGNQISIFAEQNWRIDRLKGKGLDFAITDSPLPLPSFYKPTPYHRNFDSIVFEAFNSYNNVNYFLNRVDSFEKIGRRHNENDSIEIAGHLQQFMRDNGIEFTALDATPQTPEAIFRDLISRQKPLIDMPLRLPDEQ